MFRRFLPVAFIIVLLPAPALAQAEPGDTGPAAGDFTNTNGNCGFDDFAEPNFEVTLGEDEFGPYIELVQPSTGDSGRFYFVDGLWIFETDGDETYEVESSETGVENESGNPKDLLRGLYSYTVGDCTQFWNFLLTLPGGIVAYVLAQESPPPPTTTTTTTTTTVAPPPPPAAVAEPEPEPTPEPAAESAESDESAGDGGGSGGILAIGIAALIAAVAGGLTYVRTRARGRQGSDIGGGKDDDDGDDPRDTPAPAVYGEQLERPSCDWSLYFHDGEEWKQLRKPQGLHECCVYRIKVQTKIQAHVQAAKARQDAGEGRLYIPEFDFGWQGVDLNGHTSTRSGPHGRLDWMQGLGDPTEQAALASDNPYVQNAQGDEPQELAVHLRHDEVTKVEVSLEPGCGEYSNTYLGGGSGTLDVMATQECTNDDFDPECPVELDATGVYWGGVFGDLTYLFLGASGGDTDEIEGLMHNRSQLGPEDREDAVIDYRLRPLWDGHDHEMLDRNRHAYNTGDFAEKEIDGDTYVIWIENGYDLESNQLVPVHVWPTTERVSTHIESNIKHAITIHGKMIPLNCASNGCQHVEKGEDGAADTLIDHGDCGCKPEFEMSFEGDVTTIEFDDKSVEIHRDPVSANRREPPSVGEYESWKLV